MKQKYIIDFIADTDTSNVQSLLQNVDATVIRKFEQLGQTYLIEATAAPQQSSLYYCVEDATISIMPFSNANIETEIISMSDEKSWWKVSTIHVHDYNQAELLHYRNTLPVDVYVLDSGCTIAHPEFVNSDVQYLYAYDGVNEDSTGHGTAVASIIGGKTLSLANVNLKIVKIFGDQSTTLSHVLEALDTIIADHKRSGIPAIANFSWATTKNNFLESKIQLLYDNDIMIVCAAGSNNLDVDTLTPQSMPLSITVGAYNKDFKPCDYTNNTSVADSQKFTVNGGTINIWAPGEEIICARSDGSYASMSGTSLAAAVHTSALAHCIGGYYTKESSGQYLSRKNFSYSLHFHTVSNRYNFLDIPEGSKYLGRTCISTVYSQIRNAQDIMLNPNLKGSVIPHNTQFFDKMFFTTGVDYVELVGGNLPPGMKFVDGGICGITPPIDVDREFYVADVKFVMVRTTSEHHIRLHFRVDRPLT